MNKPPVNPELPILDEAAAPRRLPRWLKRVVPKGNANDFTARVVETLRLETVCTHARCPNRMECYAQQTATFMILGDVCSRSCSFCSVARGQPQPPPADEPERVAEAAARLELRHVVLTSVTRDDLPDGGAEHFFRCVLAVRERTGATVEVLTPDFLGQPAAIDRVVAAAPEVFNHNVETVPRLYRPVRGPKADYRRTLALLARVKQRNPRIKTKSGLMLGLGETLEELLDVLADLRDRAVDFLTVGQYLQPDPTRCLPVVRYWRPEEFTVVEHAARALGFREVASGPFVRSSYHAREMLGA